MQILPKLLGFPKMALLAAIITPAIIATSTLTGCGQKGALYLPTSNSQPAVDPVAKSTSTTDNAYESKIDATTQVPNVMIENNASPEANSATTPSVGGKNDY